MTDKLAAFDVVDKILLSAGMVLIGLGGLLLVGTEPQASWWPLLANLPLPGLGAGFIATAFTHARRGPGPRLLAPPRARA